MDQTTVGAFVAFQRLGTGFGAVWQDIQPVVEKTVRRELFKRLVRGHKSDPTRLGMNVTAVHRNLHEAYDLLRPLLRERGVDGQWRPGIGL